MVTKKKNAIPEFKEYFDGHLTSCLLKGENCRDLYTEAVDDFYRKMNRHVYIVGQPGVGKTYTVETTAKKYPNIYNLTLKGNFKPWALYKTVATNLYNLPKSMKLAVYIDDCNHIFKGSNELIDIFKTALDVNPLSGDRLEYNISLGAQFENAEENEKEAIRYYKSLDPNRAGFVVPFDNRVRFIFTMNTPLPSERDLQKLDPGSDKWQKTNNRAAIMSRVHYENLMMDKETYWGWIASVVWNNVDTMCVGATTEQRYDMLSWLWDNWPTVSEHSLRFIETKMWYIMKDHPERHQYRRRWAKL